MQGLGCWTRLHFEIYLALGLHVQMSLIVPAIFLLALAVILPLYAMYFISLHRFGKEFRQFHPGLYEKLLATGRPSLSPVNGNYRAFQAIQSGKVSVEALNPLVLSSYRLARKRLLLGLSCFMVLLFSGLAISLNK